MRKLRCFLKEWREILNLKCLLSVAKQKVPQTLHKHLSFQMTPSFFFTFYRVQYKNIFFSMSFFMFGKIINLFCIFLCWLSKNYEYYNAVQLNGSMFVVPVQSYKTLMIIITHTLKIQCLKFYYFSIVNVINILK